MYASAQTLLATFEILLLLNIDEAQGQKDKECIRAKCMQYMERADKLRNYTEKKTKEVMTNFLFCQLSV